MVFEEARYLHLKCSEFAHIRGFEVCECRKKNVATVEEIRFFKVINVVFPHLFKHTKDTKDTFMIEA